MNEKYSWLTRRSKRVVKNLRLWQENPRLSTTTVSTKTIDYASALIADSAEKSAFLKLAKSIATKGYIPAEPIVVWQNPTDLKFYVAEGNRRVLAMKLLLNYELAPKEIKTTFQRLAKTADAEDFRQIPVAIAPSFEEAEWYISQRHSRAGTHKRWEPEQQYRWIAKLYEEYKGNLSEIRERAQLSESEINKTLAVLTFKKTIFPKLKGYLSQDVFDKANSSAFYLTTLERLLFNGAFQKHISLRFDKIAFELEGDEQPFLFALSDVVRRMYLTNKDPERIDSRVANDGVLIQKLLQKIPPVPPIEKGNITTNTIETFNEENLPTNRFEPKEELPSLRSKEKRKRPPASHQQKLIPPEVRWLTNITRINGIFNELKEANIEKQFNSVAVLYRSYLDMIVYQYLRMNKSDIEMLKEDQLALDQFNTNRLAKIVKYFASIGADESLVVQSDLKKAVGGAFRVSKDRIPTLKEMLTYLVKTDTLLPDAKLRQALASYVKGTGTFLDHNDFNLLVHNEYFLKTPNDLKHAWDQLFPILDFINQQLK